VKSRPARADSCRRRRRLVALDEREVTFRYKDYRFNGPARYCTMTLAPDEFIRRFCCTFCQRGFIAPPAR
jgi:hypothetical protein